MSEVNGHSRRLGMFAVGAAAILTAVLSLQLFIFKNIVDTRIAELRADLAERARIEAATVGAGVADMAAMQRQMNTLSERLERHLEQFNQTAR